MRTAISQKKRLRRRKRILKAYAARAIALVVVGIFITLMSCGFLFIWEHLFARDKVYEEELERPVVSIEQNDPVPMKSTGGKVVVVDAGHGGKDEGTSWDNIKEKDLVLDMALMLKEELESLGITVIMTREDDTFLSLESRAEAANEINADLFISVHIDYFEDDSSISGLTCHYMEGSKSGETLASDLSEYLRKSEVTEVRNTIGSDFRVLAKTEMPALLIETGFLSNAGDRKNLTDTNFQKKLMNSIAEGIYDVIV